MVRYIDAELLIKNFAKRLNNRLGITIKLDDAAVDLSLAIADTPTADVVEVKRGYWKTVTETKDNTVCGNNAKIQYKICSNCKKPMGLTGADYCGWCGAKMDVSKMEITTEGGKAE